MALPVWISNLIAYALQIAILTATGTLLMYLFRLRVPRVTLIYWQVLLLLCLLVPALQPWKHAVYSSVTTSTESVEMAPVVSYGAVPLQIAPAVPIRWEVLWQLLAAGSLLRLVWLAIGFVRLRKLQRKAHAFPADQSISRDLRWRTGVRVTLLLSREIDSPVTFGFRTPTVILPLSFQDLSEACQQSVLCHELLHVRRCDWILILIEEIVRSIFWFHPAIWWLISRIHLSREQAVDHEVVQITGSKQPYLDSLLEFARSQGRPRAVPAPLFLKERNLVQRVALLIREVSMSRLRLAVSCTGIFVLLIGTFYLSTGWFPLTGAPVLAQEQNGELVVNAPKREPLRVGGNIAESILISRVDPIYPEEARRARIQGSVVLTVTVNEEGYVYEIRIESGHPLLQQAAIDAVKQWRYSPTLLNGEPVPVMATVTVVFRLKDDAARMENLNLNMRTVSSGSAQPVPGQFANPEAKPPHTSAYRVNGDVQESKLIYKVNPVYPEQAKAERMEGPVHLQVTINEEGLVSGIIVSPGNYEVLEEAAIDAVKQWKYSPTLMNGEPVPVFADVTVVFQLRDPDDLVAQMDEAGNLNRELSQILQSSGTITLRIAPATPYRIVANTVRELIQKGVQKIKLSMPFALYQGQVFYAGTPSNSQQMIHDIDMQRMISLAQASGRFEKGKPYRLIYRLFINEAGEAVGLQQIAGPETPEIEKELMLLRRIPAIVGSDTVPYMCPIAIHFILP